MKVAQDEAWTVEKGHNDFDIIRGNQRIAGYILHEEHANLMAAAPELLSALKHAYEWLDELGCRCESDRRCATCHVEAAIAKAEGR